MNAAAHAALSCLFASALLVIGWALVELSQRLTKPEMQSDDQRMMASEIPVSRGLVND